ncbi:MAG TPA: ribonuclease HII [Rhizomicrobium sp.]|jgi:ribonuclease HII|nr:ribonuclease HII [Rhizomicrobium sp.]
MPHFRHEKRLLAGRAEPFFICGVDEAGRGPLAGPVVAAAVILDFKKYPRGLNDSKQLTEEEREASYPRIMEMALAVGIGEASVGEIDLVNIRQATHLAMARAVRALSISAGFALVDGNDPPALPCPCETIIGGDGASLSIAAASIVAKVTRDRMMVALHDEHPGYNWKSNKGYGTPEHYDGLKAHGVTVHHRRSFAPIYNILYGDGSVDSINKTLIPQDS